MLKDFFLNEVTAGINKAIEEGKLGQMEVNDKYSLMIEKPKILNSAILQLMFHL